MSSSLSGFLIVSHPSADLSDCLSRTAGVSSISANQLAVNQRWSGGGGGGGKQQQQQLSGDDWLGFVSPPAELVDLGRGHALIGLAAVCVSSARLNIGCDG